MTATALLFALLPGLLKAAEEIIKAISDDGQIDEDEAREIAEVTLINAGVPSSAATWLAYGLVEALVGLGVWDSGSKRLHLHSHRKRWLNRLELAQQVGHDVKKTPAAGK